MKWGFISGLFLFACEKHEQSPLEKKMEQTRIHTEEISYFRDVRTGLCFAYVWTGLSSGGGTITNVPCSPEVIKLLRPVPDWNKNYF